MFTSYRGSTSWRAAACGLLLPAALLAPHWAGAAATSGITVTTTVPQASSSYSIAGQSRYVFYKMALSNAGGNVVNNVVLKAKATTTVPGGSVALDTWQVSGLGTCSRLDPAASGGYGLRCDLGQVRPGEGTSVTLQYIAPSKGSALGATPNDLVNFIAEANYAEGLNDSTGAQRLDTQVVQATPSVTLSDDFSIDRFTTAVPFAGGTFSTGANGETTPTGDPWTTTVAIPGATVNFVPASTVERTDGILESSDLTDRRISAISIPNTNYFNGNPATSPRLVITLKRDFSTIRKGSKIANAVLYYTKSLSTDDTVVPADRRPVIACADAPGGVNGPYQDETGTWRPCLREKVSVPAKKVVNGKSEGYWKFVIEAYENGRYIN